MPRSRWRRRADRCGTGIRETDMPCAIARCDPKDRSPARMIWCLVWEISGSRDGPVHRTFRERFQNETCFQGETPRFSFNLWIRCRAFHSDRGSHGPSVSGTNVVAVWRAFQEVSLDKRRQNDAAGVAVECPEAACLSFSELQPWHFDVLAPHTHKKCGHAWSRSSLAALSFNSFGNHCCAHVCHRPRSGEGTSVIHVTRLVLVEPDVLPSPRNGCETVSSR